MSLRLEYLIEKDRLLMQIEVESVSLRVYNRKRNFLDFFTSFWNDILKWIA